VVAFVVSGLFNSLHVSLSHLLYFFVYLGVIVAAGRAQAPSGKRGWIGVRFAAVLLGGFVTAVATKDAVADRSFQNAMKRKDPASRARILEHAVSLGPRARTELARSYVELKRYADAARHFREVLRKRPYHVESLNGLALALIRCGVSTQEVDNLFELGIHAAPFYFKTYYNRGGWKIRLGDWSGARAQFGEALRRRPEYGPAYLYRGVAFAAEGNFPAALEDFRKAKALDPSLVDDLRREQPAIAGEKFFEEIFEKK